MPIRKALSIDGESKVVDYLLRGKYEITNTSWSKLHTTSTISVRIKYILLLKEKEDLEDPNTDKRKNKLLSQNLLCFILTLLLNKLHYINIITCLF